ncbi:hypothetical protein [Gottfriedia luciferensis]|uniref:hypothetical protein n=1 Tax=Gottfriedia luciferensis TaxID=178774 RepID=UPI000B42FBCA|nr:hypothetical protein [Gottfriedia luciferensis]
MKKWLIPVLFVAIVFVVFESKVYYPPLPISSVSKKEVISKLKDSPKNIVKIGDEDGFEWFITRSELGKSIEQGTGFRSIRRMLGEKGWTLDSENGSAYFFKRGKQTLIVETEMWTKKYVILHVEKGWNK